MQVQVRLSETVTEECPPLVFETFKWQGRSYPKYSVDYVKLGCYNMTMFDKNNYDKNDENDRCENDHSDIG